jgi:hypothetical protein
MLKFVSAGEYTGPKMRVMSLEEYADFSEACLESNSRITPENCMDFAEKISRPFTFFPERNPA